MYDPKKIRPMGHEGTWVLILDDMKSEKTGSGLLFKPSLETNAEKVTEGSGTLIRIGNSEKFKTLGVEVGQRVLYRSYLKYANPIETDEKWPNGSRKVYFLMSVEDVMGIIEGEGEVGVYSGRPQIPSK